MKIYSKINKGYNYIFTNIDIFSKYAWSFPIKTKKIQGIKSCFQKYLKNVNLIIYGQINNHHFSVKKC